MHRSVYWLCPVPFSGRTSRSWRAVLALAVVALGMSGAFTFRSFQPWWCISEAACLSASLSFLALVHYCDPGCIQQNEHEDPVIAELNAQAATIASPELTLTLHMDGIRYKLSRLEGIWTRLGEDEGRGERWCKTCRIWRPGHAHHCRTCDRCIAFFDHHCDTVDACIGQLNQRWLTLFLISTLCGSVLLLAASLEILARWWKSGVSMRRAAAPGCQLCGMHLCTVTCRRCDGRAWPSHGQTCRRTQVAQFNKGAAVHAGPQSVPWQVWLTMTCTATYFYAVCMSSFGIVHLLLMLTDLRTKDVLTRKDACAHCCAFGHKRGRHATLLRAWRRQWCGVVVWTRRGKKDGQTLRYINPGVLPGGLWHQEAQMQTSTCDHVQEPLL